MRTASALDTLKAPRESGRVSFEDISTLKDVWSSVSRIRTGNALTSGRVSGIGLDTLPRGLRDLKSLTRALGYRAGHERDVKEDWMRCARGAREVVDRLF